MLGLALLALIAVNLWSFVSFGIDKRRSIAGRWRIAERDLLMLVIIGGSVGALLGRAAFRHKTRKEPFSTYLAVIATVQIGGLLGWWIAT